MCERDCKWELTSCGSSLTLSSSFLSPGAVRDMTGATKRRRSLEAVQFLKTTATTFPIITPALGVSSSAVVGSPPGTRDSPWSWACLEGAQKQQGQSTFSDQYFDLIWNVTAFLGRYLNLDEDIDEEDEEDPAICPRVPSLEVMAFASRKQVYIIQCIF